MQESLSFVAFAACGPLSSVSHAQTHTRMPSRSFRGSASASLFLLFPILANFTECCHVSSHFVQYLAIETAAKQTLQPHDKVNPCTGGSRVVASALIFVNLFIYFEPSHNDTNR